MGKALKWFRSLLSSKKSPEPSQATKKKKTKSRLSNSSTTSIKFSNHVEDPRASPYVDGLDANKHAIAVAAATAAVAEAALAAAQAAAQVVRLTSGGGNGSGSGRSAPYGSGDRRAVWAAVKIQSAFRAYLARRALRALKGLVKLQALVRGHIVRKQSSDMLHRMQTMARIQARASAHRFYTECSNANIKFYNSHYQGVTNLRKYEEKSYSAKHGGSLLKQNHPRSNIGNSVNKETSHLASRWLNHWMEQSTWKSLHDTSLENRHGDDERSDKILEIDTWKPHRNTMRQDQTIPTSHYFSAWSEMEQDYTKVGPSRLSSKLQNPNPSISSEEVPSLISSKFPPEGDQVAAWTAENSPRLHSASSRPTSNIRGPYTPARSECSRSLFSDYLGHPSYMANTESSRAKVRSHSAPKQRVQFEEVGKYGHGIWDSDTISEMGYAFPANRKSNAHLHAGQVKRQVNGATGFNSIYGRRL